LPGEKLANESALGSIHTTFAAAMIDTHAHVYDEKFKNDFAEMISACRAHGVHQILMPNCDSSTIAPMLACEAAVPEMCIPMLGVHPCYVTDMYEYELNKIEALWATRSFVAVGEIGLDYHWDMTYVQEQKIAFRRQIELALTYKKPICVHSRESTQDCIDIVKSYIAQGLQGVFHCYSGTVQEAHQLLALDFYFGIGGVLTYKNSGLALIVTQLPKDRILLETDAPYLAPVPHRGKRNEPAYTSIVAQHLADIWQMSVEETTTICDANATKLFGLNSAKG
jgi:TatD DNase family protein